MKTCTKCKVEKDEALFSKRKSAKDGLSSCCKVCNSNDGKRYRFENKKKVLDAKKLYRENNKEKIKIAKKEYRELNKDSISIKNKEYKLSNRARIRISERKIEEYHRKVLSDKYIKSLLVNKTSISKTSIPKDMVEAKRMQMMINRKLKELRE